MQKRFNTDLSLLLFPVLLFSLSFFTLLSSVPKYAYSQLFNFLVGILAFLVISRIDCNVYRYFAKYFYMGILIVLLFTYILGEIRLGAARWLNFGLFTVQPSEFAKLALIIFISSLLVRQNSLAFKNVVKYISVCLPAVILVVLQPDLGTSIILMLILTLEFWYAGLSNIYFLLFFIIFGSLSSPLWNALHDYQQKRILIFLNPSLDTLGAGYNVIQALIAVGSGGLWGRGFGNGSQVHFGFLPSHWTDFILASFAEEWGYIGLLFFLFIYLALLYKLLKVSFGSKDAFSSLVAFGIFVVFFFQFVINTGMNLGVLPVTGIPLPLMSYGGSSLLVSMVMLGISNSILSKSA
jgi:rod shape determining protein RodA